MRTITSFAKLHLLALTLWSTACGDARITAPKASPCEKEAVVLDMRNLDGCRFLLQLPDGTKLLPTNWPADFQPQGGEKVWVTYTTLEGGASACMAENEIIEISCLQPRVHDESNILRKCIPVKDPMRIDWMRAAVIDMDPNRIDRYDYKEGYAYLFYAQESKRVYDCNGRLLCEQAPKERGCDSLIATLKNQTVIWVLNN